MPTPEREEKIQRVLTERQLGVVVLEDISDPHNAAAVLRSCDAFGFHKVFFVFHEEKLFDPSRVGKLTSASANKWLELRIFTSTQECFSRLKQENYRSIATSLGEDSRSLLETDLSEPKLAWWFGNEHRGLSSTATENCDLRVQIPMRGMVQSLNLSVTAALCLYETTRQRSLLSPERYRYSQEEQEVLKGSLLQKSLDRRT